ncbi:MAG TPA: Ni/Fe hydrogenase subunit alpha [Spongiibacteraceae bacterium]|nr:Ni/Fe hydrogenase subunit alpha [Spongiibacteraceae bacterium]
MTTRTINVDYIARVEGEAALHIGLDGDRVNRVELAIFEPPRFFEALLRGRQFTEAVDITARICGICPVAYMMSAAHAMEDVCGVKIEGPIRELRRLLYCGEWIESHVLHVAMLHLPDFLGYHDAMAMAKDHPEPVQTALRIKALGNRILRILGGREIHPINVRVGGFYKAPARADLLALRSDIDWAIVATQKLLQLTGTLNYPDLNVAHELFALKHDSEYPFNEGRIASTSGVYVAIRDYESVLAEHQVPHSTSLQTKRINGVELPVYLGPAARLALNHQHLTPLAREAFQRYGLENQLRNPYRNIQSRCVEVLFALEEAARIIDNYQIPERPYVDVEPRAGTGYGCTEAPRGSCFHRYSIDEQGLITEAKIVAPTSVNQTAIESDLRQFVQNNLQLSDDALREGCEHVIRNFDPCISCSAHFLKLTIDRYSAQ